MLDTNIHSQDVIFALDIGTRSVIGTVGVVKDKKFYVLGEVYEEHEERAMIDGQIHNIELVAHTVGKDRKSTRLNSSHANISYAVFCLKKNKIVTNDNHDCRRSVDYDLQSMITY